MLFFKKKVKIMLVTTNYAKKNYASTIYQSYSVLSSVPVWQSYGHPHSQNPSDIGIPCNPNHNPNREGNMRRGCPYYCKNTPEKQLFLSVALYYTVRNIMICHGIQTAHASLRDLFDRQGDFTNIDREIDHLGACKVHWLYTSFYLFLY